MPLEELKQHFKCKEDNATQREHQNLEEQACKHATSNHNGDKPHQNNKKRSSHKDKAKGAAKQPKQAIGNPVSIPEGATCPILGIIIFGVNVHSTLTIRIVSTWISSVQRKEKARLSLLPIMLKLRLTLLNQLLPILLHQFQWKVLKFLPLWLLMMKS